MSSTTDEDCYYRILGVGKLASEKEIRKAYKRLALKFHPDKQKNPEDRQAASEIFCKINNAHEVLNDPILRKEYDTKLEASQRKRATRNSTKQQRTSSKPSGSSQSYGSSSSNAWNARYGQQSQGTSQQERTSNKRSQHQGPSGSTWNSYSNTKRNHSAHSSDWNGHYERQSQGSSRPKKSKSSSWSKSQGYHQGFSGSTPKPTPKPRSASNRQKPSSSTNGHAKQQQRTHSASSSQPKSFGTCKTTGMPCRRCMKQGRFCYQHKNQDPNSPTYDYAETRPPQPDRNSRPVYGIRADGKPCLRCMKQGRFCFQHVGQQM